MWSRHRRSPPLLHPHTGAAPGPAAAAAGPAPAADATKLSGMEDPFHAQLHLPELDDDCLRLLLGEDADESVAPAAAAPAAAAAPGSGNASEKSSACHGEWSRLQLCIAHTTSAARLLLGQGGC